MAQKSGIDLPNTLLRATEPPAENFEPDPTAEASSEESRGDSPAETRAARASRRSKRSTPSGKATPYTLFLPKELHRRPRLRAMETGKTVSAIAAENLEKSLPRYILTREG
jgi:hypothetical protein